MVQSAAATKAPSQTTPKFWKTLLGFVAIGKAALSRAGLALAVAGAFNVAAAVTAQHWLHDVQKSYLDYIALGGGAVGGIIGIVSRFA